MAVSPVTPQGGIGSVSVINNCAQPVYHHVSGFKNGEGWDGPTELIQDSGFHIPYDTSVSVKLFHDPAVLEGSISQLEFSLDTDVGRVWYDLSNVDGFRDGNPPFMQSGMILTPIGVPDAACAPVHCPRNVWECKDAYNAPRDDKTYTCPMSTNLHMVLCPDDLAREDQTEQLGRRSGGFLPFIPARGPPGPVARREEEKLVGNEKDFFVGDEEGVFPGNEEESFTDDDGVLLVGTDDMSLKKAPKKRDSLVIEGHTVQKTMGSSRSSKSHIAKLPVLGMVAGFACYFITAL